MKKTAAVKVFLMLLVMSAALLLDGCRSRPGDIEDNQVAGFLFHFDQRAEVKDLLALKNKGKYPSGVRWKCPDPEAHGRKETENESEAARQDRYSEDPDFIRELYTALTNVIIMGNDNTHPGGEAGYIALILADGNECRFDFPSESVLRVSEHNYSIETDGELWKLLR